MNNDTEFHFINRWDPPGLVLVASRYRTLDGAQIARRADNGAIVWENYEPASYDSGPPLLLVDGFDVPPLIEAMRRLIDPNTESKALRDALDVERRRVDHMLGIRS